MLLETDISSHESADVPLLYYEDDSTGDFLLNRTKLRDMIDEVPISKKYLTSLYAVTTPSCHLAPPLFGQSVQSPAVSQVLVPYSRDEVSVVPSLDLQRAAYRIHFCHPWRNAPPAPIKTVTMALRKSCRLSLLRLYRPSSQLPCPPNSLQASTWWPAATLH